MAKLAVAAAFGGLLMAVAIHSAMRPPMPPSTVVVVPDESAPSQPARPLRHCRTITEPDPDCDAAWDAERRRFFRTQDRQP